MTRHGKAPATSAAAESSSSTEPTGSSATADASQQSGEASTSKSTFAGEAVRQIEAVVESFRQYFTVPPHSIWNPYGTILFHIFLWIPYGFHME
jgi:hypothetical protein